MRSAITPITTRHMTQLSDAKIREELRMMSDKVEKLTSVRPRCSGPPMGTTTTW